VGAPEGWHAARHVRQARGRPAHLLPRHANSDWSNLPLSGLFVEMLRRIASLGGTGGAGEAWSATASFRLGRTNRAEVLAPLRVLDGFGLSDPPPTTGHRRGQDRRCATQRREPARLLRALRRAARAQSDDAQEPAQAAAGHADGRRAPRLRGRYRPADQAAAPRNRAGAAVCRHRRRAAAAGGRARPRPPRRYRRAGRPGHCRRGAAHPRRPGRRPEHRAGRTTPRSCSAAVPRAPALLRRLP
jgi:hypothetical protein